jgi:Uma2 family endonuclease
VDPSESASDVERKVRQYERAGVRAIWLIYPTLKSGVACENGQRREISSEGAFETPLLPGFRLEMARLFPD